MAPQRYRNWLLLLLVLSPGTSLYGMFPNLTRNDPLPLFSSVYPYSFLATQQKANLMRFDYEYTQPRFRVSLSGYRQYANRGRNSERSLVNLGDMNGRWNMLALFYDPKLANVLYPALNIDPTTTENAAAITFITNPRNSDPNKEFGFFSIPMIYRKYGVRFESELLLIDSCFHALGIMIQWGINDVRQTVIDFEDFTSPALGTSSPTYDGAITGSMPPPAPPTQPPLPIASPFINEATTTVPPCPEVVFNPTEGSDCVPLLQTFQPCSDTGLCLSFTGLQKQFVIQNIMRQKDLIAEILGLDICNYHKTGLDDLRLSMYWRHVYVVNEDDNRYPRLIFMPFVQAGVGIPMMKEVSNNKPFAVPNGNNRHTFVGGRAGFTLDFLDTIDFSFAAGFSYFFEHEYCNYFLPTNPLESGIYPYSADVSIRPGPTWNVNFGMHAYHFLDNLSVWIEYAIVSHTNDKIKVCRSFIPEGSKYFNTGFDVELAECLTKWESHVVNVGFNYDLFDCLAVGILWQAPARQRNVYRSGTVLGTLSFVY
jgi:hypothetical protein